MMSRLRRHVFHYNGGSFNVVPLPRPRHPAAPSQLAFQKSQADRAVIHSRGQGERKCRPWCDFRAVQPHFGRLEGSGKVQPFMPLYGLPTRSAFGNRSSGYHTPRSAKGESIPQNSPFARQRPISYAFRRFDARRDMAERYRIDIQLIL